MFSYSKGVNLKLVTVMVDLIANDVNVDVDDGDDVLYCFDAGCDAL